MASNSAPRTHCIHRWAHNESEHGHGKTGPVRFDGMSLFHHATVVAVKYPKKNTVVIAGDGIYNSQTTQCVKRRVVNAMPGMSWKFVYADCDRYGYRLQTIDGLRKCHDEMLVALKGRVPGVLSARRGASQAIAADGFRGRLETLNRLGDFLGRKRRNMSDFFTEEEHIAIMASSAKRREAREKREIADREHYARERELRKQKEVEIAQAWRNREANITSWYLAGTYLRLSKCGRFVETSRGVVVPIKEAEKLFRICGLVKAGKVKDPELRERIDVGSYSVGRIEENGDCHVGCHYLTYEEMEMCFNGAKERGLVKDGE